MFVYTYDGSFDGLLTCVYQYYYSTKKAETITYKYNYLPDLIHEEVYIETDEEKSTKVITAIESKIGSAALKNIFTLFLSEEKGIEMLILNYIKLGFKIGPEIHNHLHNPIVAETAKCCRRVNYEAHRMCGFVRFKCISEEIYYSSIEPDHNILTIIAPHFSERFSNQKWLIHDIKRDLAIIYDTNQWVLSPFNKSDAKILLSTAEGIYEELWKTYYKTVAIKERENPRLRRQMMPQRYWKHMLEVRE